LPPARPAPSWPSVAIMKGPPGFKLPGRSRGSAEAGNSWTIPKPEIKTSRTSRGLHVGILSRGTNRRCSAIRYVAQEQGPAARTSCLHSRWSSLVQTRMARWCVAGLAAGLGASAGRGPNRFGGGAGVLANAHMDRWILRRRLSPDLHGRATVPKRHGSRTTPYTGDAGRGHRRPTPPGQ